MATDDPTRWARQAQRLARADVGSDGWARDLVQRVDAAADRDVGTMIVAGAVLAQRVDVRAEEVARERVEAVERARLDRVALLDERRGVDRAVMVIGLVAGVTVLVPWLLGKYKLRDTWLLPTLTSAPADVRDDARSYLGGYFWPDYLSGLAVVALLVAIILLVRRWPGRVLGILVGFALLIGCYFPYAGARAIWGEREAALNADGVYPYTKIPARDSGGWYHSTCGISDVVELDGHKYYAWTVGQRVSWFDHVRGSGGPCHSIEIYVDWDQVGTAQKEFHGESVDIDTGGRLCDTDGTPEGLVWFAPQAYGDGFFAVPMVGSATINGFTADEFAAAYPMCG
jgi:hypothetical protein